MNDEAHKMAVEALALHGQRSNDVSFPSSLVDLRSDESLTSKWQDIVQEAAHSTPIRLTMCKRSSWSEDQSNMVDWWALKHCLLGMPRVHRLSYGKLLNGLLNMNMQNRRYYNGSDLCPHYGRELETFVHVVSCPNSEVSLHRI
jgi:hypothetical protein